jgi:enolase
MFKIIKLEAREVLDSRGNPTVSCVCTLESGAVGEATVPSGASTGAHEACELRDHDMSRMDGKGVLKAVENVNLEIANFVNDKEWSQKTLDEGLVKLDGTKNKSKLGANAILAVSLAFARACAQENKIELYEHIANVYEQEIKNQDYKLPQPAFNVINGGKHSESGIPFQEFMLIPQNFGTFEKKVSVINEITAVLKEILVADGYETTLGDEGGFAPQLPSNEKALEYLVQSIEQAGYDREQVKIGIDVAANTLFKDGIYILKEKKLNTEEIIHLYENLCATYPIISIEDGLQEEDFDGFRKMNDRLGQKINIVGDDLTVTNVELITKAIAHKSINTVLIKPNQIGTLSETLNAIRIAKKNNLKIFISHRSGETLDTFISDLSVATNADFIKAGAPTKPERTIKYQRLIEIENLLK